MKYDNYRDRIGFCNIIYISLFMVGHNFKTDLFTLQIESGEIKKKLQTQV